MLLLSDFAFRFWLGDKLTIPFNLSVLFVLYNVIVLFLSPYNYFLNGVGKLNLGLRIGFFKLIVFLPVAIFFVKQFDAAGLIVALILVNSSPNFIFSKMQYHKIINKTAVGVWNK